MPQITYRMAKALRAAAAIAALGPIAILCYWRSSAASERTFADLPVGFGSIFASHAWRYGFVWSACLLACALIAFEYWPARRVPKWALWTMGVFIGAALLLTAVDFGVTAMRFGIS